FVNRKVLLTFGTRSREDEINPNYPILAWDERGHRLAVIYSEEGKVKLFVYDALNRIKLNRQELPMFDQVQDAKYMLNNNTLVMSAVKSGQTDIFVYNIEKNTAEQVTDDVYDDLDAAFVTFPNKTGIMFSSNRPHGRAVDSDTALTSDHYNIFLVDNWNKSEFKQISQLTNVRFGNARFPSQYNTYHFTFVSDENGINNRYAGFFATERAGLDTLVYIGDEVLRNPGIKEVDSLLKEWDKTDIDSVGYLSVTNDSSYVFPLTNYQSSLLETRTAGSNDQVSEVVRQGDYKFLYRLRVDENTLRRRNVSAKPTEYMKKQMEQSRAASTGAAGNPASGTDSARTNANDFFQTEFDTEKTDSSRLGRVFEAQPLMPEPVLKKAKLYEYRPPKFFSDYVVAGLNNTVYLVNKYQAYAGGAGPITLSNGNQLNGLIRMGTSDLFEDYKISGGIRIAPNLRDNDVLFEFTNLRKRFDWGFTYFRSSQQYESGGLPASKQFSSYYLARLRYALDRTKSLRISVGPRFDREVFSLLNQNIPLGTPDLKQTFGQTTLEYVHDNSISPALNIWHGLRWKAYVDWFTKLSDIKNSDGKFMFNAGVDARHYLPLYRNIIWAVRGAADFSWGSQKIVYYLGGTDGWLKFRENSFNEKTGQYRYFDAGEGNRPANDADYAYQSLAVNLRGFVQNVANGNNAVVINSEIRVPVFSTFLNRPINNAFLRNFQIVQFADLGSAWNGKYDAIKRPSVTYGDIPIAVKLKAGGIGPFAGGYGFGARSTL
ncbi:MAG TPA: hypothetical protein VHK69_09990, partial [Chitinophagaceae bacterium]|nr:hypothetical protein [Chitinophagaceae bacterium]